MDYDFKKAQRALDGWVIDPEHTVRRTLEKPLTVAEETLCNNAETIRLALRIAQAVTEEPSEGMKGAGSESSYKLDEVRPSVAAKIFRAMIEQMLVELKA